MKTIFLVFIILFVSCSAIQFSELALKDAVYDISNTQFSIKEMFQKYKGKQILVDIWASWCGDCIKSLPSIRNLQKEYPEVVFLFLSVDKSKKTWKKGIERFQIKGAHYYLPKGMKSGAFVDFIDLNWIPRYMVLDERGEITLFNAINTSDSSIEKALKKAI